MKNFKIELNSAQNIKDLLQSIYTLAEEQVTQAQNEINKLSVSTKLQELPMDAKSKYAKAINDYLGMKDKAISKKIDVAKILTEIYHHNGDVKAALDDGSFGKGMDFNFDDIKKMVDESYQEKEKTKKIKLTNKEG